ncbi:ribonuclease P protein subunit p30-like [Macrosteles quadrilineatus]|uniref:ribonuclease P protein subunit p30-like n=1 Tax=Macrosteles quadrilineatus TaxID=74068 RepID=UPI0023E24F17|nr:ribonuclease P protein subunit p30-like [Macrosteles quadrilineatus]
MKIKGFSDLNISIPYEEFTPNHAQELIDLGYQTVALTTTVEEESSNTPKKKKNNPNKEVIPAPKHLNAKINEELTRKLQILHRLTVYFSDANQLQKLCKSDNTKKYDIVSVIPTSTNAFQLACACKDVDLISFDPNVRLPMLNRRIYNQGLANSIFYEVPYAPAIIDAGKRKTVIQMAHAYHAYGKSKNVVITSGASEIGKVRGPYDVTNLALLLGLSEEQAKHSMSNTCRSLILRAEGRRFGKTAMTMMITGLELESEEASDEEPVAKRYKSAAECDIEMAFS